jgi:hypothetical protein
VKIQNQEKKIVSEIKKLAKAGQHVSSNTTVLINPESRQDNGKRSCEK